MQDAIPTDFDIDANVSGSVSGKQSGGGLILQITNFYNNTEKDIERLAYELEFYRQRAALARGSV